MKEDVIVHGSAGTWHGIGEEREIYETLFPKNRDGDAFLLSSTRKLTSLKSWPNKIEVQVQHSSPHTAINDVSAVQFALNLIDNYEIHHIQRAMLKYLEEEIPERLI